jgi:hypothetical protein
MRRIAVRQPRLAKLALNVGWSLFPIVVVTAFIVVELQRTALTTTISNLDYFPLLGRAVRLSFASLDGWVHQVHPVGYPCLIRLGLELGWDAERVGQAISIAGGILGLCGTYLLALSVFKDKRLAALAQAYVAATNLYMYFASVEGNDMPAAGLHLLSLGLLAASTLKRSGSRPGLAFLAGLTAGMAYLVRYTGMITALTGGTWLAALALYTWPPVRRLAQSVQQRLWGSTAQPAYSERACPKDNHGGEGSRNVYFQARPAAWKALSLYVLAFLLATALQWIPSFLATGNPFYTDQGQNVWFHVYDKTDFIREFNQAPAGITLVQVFALDPHRFISHWWNAFQGFWIDPKLTLLDAPLKLLGQAGLVFLLLARGPRPARRRWLVGLFVLAHLTALSLMRLDRRFLITMIPLLTIGALYLLVPLIPPGWKSRRASLPLNILLLLGGLAWAAQEPFHFVEGRPGPDEFVIQASNVLHAAGMASAEQVMSTQLSLQDASAPARDRFVEAHAAAPDRASVAELVQAMQTQGRSFFVYDRGTGPTIYPALPELLSPGTRPPGLVPIYFPPDKSLVIYRLQETSAACSPLEARFENGIVLRCYEVHLSHDAPPSSGRRVGVYLHWQAESRLSTSLKVFVHVIGADGVPLAQDDSLPVLWTYPTNAWQPGEVVVDFHQFPLTAGVPAGEYILQAGLYDEATGVRVKRVDAAGKVVDDKAALTTIGLPE